MSVKERWKGTKQIKFSTDEAMTLMLSVLKTEHCILIAYLFGSRVTKKDDLSSDIDIAIYTSDDFSWQDYYLLYGNLTKRLHSDRLDLVWLNRAEPILSFDVIKNGKVLFFNNADTLNDFELKVKKRYYDYILYLNKHRYQGEEEGVGL
jgi:predicted nucleotidyltransferase